MSRPRLLDLFCGAGGHLRVRLLPATQTAVTRVHITARGITDGPVVNNGAALLELARAFTAECERLAVHLHPGTPRERTLFDQEATG